MTTSTQIKLVGDELLTKVKSSGVRELPKEEMVRACGYISDSGKTNYVEFYENLLIAKGVEMGGETTSTPRESKGGTVTYSITFQVKTTATITLEGKDGLSREEIINLVTRKDLAESACEVQWDDVKDGFRDNDVEDFYITLEDEDGEEAEID